VPSIASAKLGSVFFAQIALGQQRTGDYILSDVLAKQRFCRTVVTKNSKSASQVSSDDIKQFC
jgi:hypothetical protein